jgi:flagellar hook-associated protein 2
MQTAISTVGNGSYRSLAEIGITTDAKTGALRLDEGKVRQALAKDYEGVTALFAATKAGEGLSGRLSRAIKGIKDPVHGSLTTRMKGIDRRIRDQDRRIEDQSRRLSERREQISQRLSQTNARIQEMESQAAYLTARSAQSSGNDGGGY